MSSNISSIDLTTPTSRTAIFILYMVLCIPSIPCSIFVFIQYFRKRRLVKEISTHVILAVLIYNFFQVKDFQIEKSVLKNNMIDFFILGDRRTTTSLIQFVYKNSLESNRQLLQILELLRLCL